MKIGLAQINPTIGAFELNAKKILDVIQKCQKSGIQIVVFPELTLCGYPPEDLLIMPSFIDSMSKWLDPLIKETKGITALIGCVRKNPHRKEKFLYNSAAIIEDGKLLGYQDKSLLPDYDVFSERRYFEPADTIAPWTIQGLKIGVTICEDIWQHAGAVEYTAYQKDPVQELKRHSLDMLINLSASPYYVRRFDTRLKVSVETAKTLKCPVLFCNQVGGNDSLIFDGYSMVVNEKGNLVQSAKGFEEDLLVFDTKKPHPSVSLGSNLIEDLYKALVLGLKDYFHKQGFSKACLGLSGGIDSAVVACIAKEALGKDNLLTLCLPSRFTSAESGEDAKQLAKNLNVELQEVSIEKPFQAYLEILQPHSFGKTIDIAEENLQARIRGMILMAFSNKYGFIVLGTGNKSELAMGYSTLYGDMCGGLEVIGDLTKAEVYQLAKWINREKEIIPERVIIKEPSAELRPNQKDRDTLPDYAIVDQVIKDYVEDHLSIEEIAAARKYPLNLVVDLVRKIHLNEYKRRQAPPSLRVTKKSFTIGRRFPIVQHWNVRVK